MEKKQIYAEPSDVSADLGNVTVEGPDGVAVVLTPDAAEQTSDRLWTGALEARAQKRQESADEKPEDQADEG
jgi:hypothetical protein